MRTTLLSRATWVSLVMVLALAAISLPASAQEIGPVDAVQQARPAGGGGTVSMPTPTIEQMEWSETMPLLTPDQQKQQETWLSRTNLPGPQRKTGEFEALGGADAVPGSEFHSKRIAGSNRRRVERQLASAWRCPGVPQL